ncbi:unnamed protein product [Rotaria socialis]|uniref:Uncharacterized protein n=1 Tax=Rotaria socialis TaxID=392032 RepID=A0A818DZH7_9BILA|nr:unnamed protein product [Rotaria socialis]CAF4598607.1 unnamed protein product [Rotaria socialis]
MLFAEKTVSSDVAFGTTVQNRPTFPTDIAHDCFGNHQTPLRGVPQLGPGSYNNEDKSTFRYVLDHQPMSRRGYTFNARTEERKTFEPKTDVPSPDAYQMDLTHLPDKKRSFKPFNAASQRFHTRCKSAGAPGPGSYECDVKQNRQVHMLHNFGGRTKLVPLVKTKCMSLNTDKCLICLQTPVGDYYQYRKEILCATCYNFNWQWQEKFKRTYLQAFQKVRDCSYVHEHAGTSAKIQLVDDKVTKKLQRKEAYLSLYWP